MKITLYYLNESQCYSLTLALTSVVRAQYYSYGGTTGTGGSYSDYPSYPDYSTYPTGGFTTPGLPITTEAIATESGM